MRSGEDAGWGRTTAVLKRGLNNGRWQGCIGTSVFEEDKVDRVWEDVQRDKSMDGGEEGENEQVEGGFDGKELTLSASRAR